MQFIHSAQNMQGGNQLCYICFFVNIALNYIFKGLQKMDLSSFLRFGELLDDNAAAADDDDDNK